jgi:hypothetical protein
LNISNTFIRDKNLQNAELQKNMNEYLEILANILKDRQIKFILRIYQKSKNYRIKNIIVFFEDSLYKVSLTAKKYSANPL